MKTNFAKSALQLSVCTACGIVFGLAAEKGRVFEPDAIQSQMLFHKYIMLKMFLGAVCSALFSLSLLSMFHPAKTTHAMHLFSSALIDKGVFSSIVGAVFLGSGMTLSGSCPGMVMIQIGAGTLNAGWTFFGGLFGVLLYSLLAPTIVGLTRPSKPVTYHFLHQSLETPYFSLALPFVAVFAAVLFGLELLVPWKQELSVQNEYSRSVLYLRAWPPYFSGALIGLLQIPVVLAVGDTIGGSSSYCTLLSLFLVIEPLQKLLAYLKQYQSGIHYWWQVFYLGGAVLGAHLSSLASYTYGSTEGVMPLMGFLGGALMLFGARLAAGCTSGHGLSGMALFSILSLASVPAMFAGAIGTAILMKNF